VEVRVIASWLYELSPAVVYPVTILLIVGAGELGRLLGKRSPQDEAGSSHIGTLTGGAIGLVGLLLAFSFSIALSRYEVRRNWVLEEANAISSTANFALMLPQPTQRPILDLLREYTEVRIGLDIPFDPAKLDKDIARSVDLQAKLWQQAVAVTAMAPQSLPAYRFVASLNEVNNIHERRITALRYNVPAPIMVILVAVAMVAMGFTGYLSGAAGAKRRMANPIMAITVAVLIMLIIDLDRPARGIIVVPTTPLIDALQGMPANQ
jgi:hypothetical protein